MKQLGVLVKILSVMVVVILGTLSFAMPTAVGYADQPSMRCGGHPEPGMAIVNGQYVFTPDVLLDLHGENIYVPVTATTPAHFRGISLKRAPFTWLASIEFHSATRADLFVGDRQVYVPWQWSYLWSVGIATHPYRPGMVQVFVYRTPHPDLDGAWHCACSFEVTAAQWDEALRLAAPE